jgi:hypothetical protein
MNSTPANSKAPHALLHACSYLSFPLSRFGGFAADGFCRTPRFGCTGWSRGVGRSGPREAHTRLITIGELQRPQIRTPAGGPRWSRGAYIVRNRCGGDSDQTACLRSPLIRDSAGIPSPSCNRQIILSVSDRRRLSTSWTRLRLPMKGIRSRGLSPF